ncbi:uncharacterized protein LOC131676770 [Topomyia yanbarensis]|uniref:uncharacterized protein LOC131676770 n=1 Tax=Topomyia yanbarensis TaxID=2498891 RepID=UPI00273CF492|nr:uncharacterized protein LOC131676770 [Topomyia yanbarensis]
MQVPDLEPSDYCRLCFSQHHLKWVLESSQHPLVDQITECLGLWLAPEEDFPCTICRFCSASLETFEAFRERSKDCDLALRKSRLVPVNLADYMEFSIGDIKQESLSIENEPLDEETAPESVLESPQSPESTISEEAVIVESANFPFEPVAESLAPPSEPVAPKQQPVKIRIISGKFRAPKGVTPPIHVCEFCKRQFAFKGYLRKHLRQCHTNKQPVELPAGHQTQPIEKRVEPAKLVAISPKELRKQMNLYCGPAVPKEQLEKKKCPSRFGCEICHAKFTNVRLYMTHLKDVHGKSPKGTGAGNKPR